MERSAAPALLTLVAAVTLGCGRVEIPVTLALAGDDAISLEIPVFPPPDNVFGSSLVGGAEARVFVDLNPRKLLTPNGLFATLVVDRVRMAAEPIDLVGLDTGVVCIYDDAANPGGGFALLRPLRKRADFHLTLNTLISPTSPLLQSLLPEPLPFAAQIDETIRLSLSDLLGLIAGGAGSLELSQQIQATLPDDVPLLAGSIVTAQVTLAAVRVFPEDPLLDACEDFLAGR